MLPQPIYSDIAVNPAFCLRYSWTSWPSARTFKNLVDSKFLDVVTPLGEQDGLRLLEFTWSPESIQLTFSTTPDVSPVFLARRSKGRLQHALRKAGNQQEFSRKLSVRSVGENTAEQVEAYIEDQVPRRGFADPQFEQKMSEFTIVNPTADLLTPSYSKSGRYW